MGMGDLTLKLLFIAALCAAAQGRLNHTRHMQRSLSAMQGFVDVTDFESANDVATMDEASADRNPEAFEIAETEAEGKPDKLVCKKQCEKNRKDKKKMDKKKMGKCKEQCMKKLAAK